jgi:hypothetical protein
MAEALRDLAAAGVAVWLDDLNRTRILSGSLTDSVESGEIVGITTNPTIFAKAIGSGSGYEDQVRELALRGTAIGESLRLLTAWDVRAACDIMRPVFDRTEGRDGVSRSKLTLDLHKMGRGQRPRHAVCGGWSIGRTFLSKSRRRSPVSRRSRRRWRMVSASTSL